MKIKTSEFFKQIGTVFNVHEDIKNEDFTVIEKGTYIIVSQNEHGYDLYEIYKGKNILFEPDLIEDIEFNTVYTSPEDTIDFLIDSLNKSIVELSAEGWVLDPENKYFDLTPYLNRLYTLTQTKRILSQIKDENDRSAYT